MFKNAPVILNTRIARAPSQGGALESLRDHGEPTIGSDKAS